MPNRSHLFRQSLGVGCGTIVDLDDAFGKCLVDDQHIIGRMHSMFCFQFVLYSVALLIVNAHLKCVHVFIVF